MEFDIFLSLRKESQNVREMRVKRAKFLSENCSSAKLNSAKVVHFDPLIRELFFP